MSSERLVALAGRFASGANIDWESEVRSSLDDQERAVIESMRLLESISRAHQAVREPPTASLSTVPLPPSAVAGQETLQTWGRLERLVKIGEGSYGVVYRAWDPNLEIWVALKLAKQRAQGVGNQEILEEARLLARTLGVHENVVRIYDAAEHDGRLGITMEFLAGKTLQDIVDFSGPMNEQQTAHIGHRLSRALGEIHRAGIIHKDIKANNVMHESGGRIVLMDFGAGVRRKVPGDGDAWASGLRGTPYYLSPEDLEGKAPTEKSDIYSLGVLLFYLVTGEYPVEGNTIADLQVAHRTRKTRSLAVTRPDLSTRFCEIVDRALHSDPAERFENAGTMARALESSSLGQHGMRVTQPELVSQTEEPNPPPWWRSRLRLVAVVCAAIALSGAIYWSYRRSTSYSIEATFHRLSAGGDQPLLSGSRVQPGDRLYLELQASRPLYTYILNWDEAGKAAILFPIPGIESQNPLPASMPHRLPGTMGNQPIYWQVTSAGEREHYLVATSLKPLPELEAVLSKLPPARRGQPVEFPSMDPTDLLRGTLGLQTGDASTAAPVAESLRLIRELTDATERQRGIWVRRLDLDNPRP